MNLNINLKDNSYSILINKNLLNIIDDIIFNRFSIKNIVIITDKNVNLFYGNKVEILLKKKEYNVIKIVLPFGEKIKNIKYVLKIYKKLILNHINRNDLIIALGGGVIGDLVGFVASTYLRGVKFIQIATSLLSQVDSSIGGKVGINLKEGKNLIGSFYHPKLVIIDTETIKTLPKKFFIDGMSEIVKYGAIFDYNIFKIINENNYFKNIIKNYNFDDLIYSCCFLKKTIIEKDEKELKNRMLLNFGHTIGHAIEKSQNYNGYSHGEAVAIGMCVITKGSEVLGYTEPGTYKILKDIIEKIGLPINFPFELKKNILKSILNDKKITNKFINLILLKKIGNGFIKKISHKKLNEIINKGL